MEGQILARVLAGEHMQLRGVRVRVRVAYSKSPEYSASAGARLLRGSGPGTNFDPPVKFIRSRFHVSMNIGVIWISAGDAITCA
jgi:hypothetical protein